MHTGNAKPPSILTQMILEAREIRENLNYAAANMENKRNNLALVNEISRRSLKMVHFYTFNFTPNEIFFLGSWMTLDLKHLCEVTWMITIKLWCQKC